MARETKFNGEHEETSAGIIETSLRHHESNGLGSGADCEGLSPLRCFFAALTRKKPLDGRTDTSLNRCLTLVQLTALGVGSTLGLGLYILTGQVASNKAGPGVVISFALAAIASAFSALCYAEFAGKVPRAGSAYAYSYITVGEFVAFVIGWNLVLEYVIGASTVARGFSSYLKTVYKAAQGLGPAAIGYRPTGLSSINSSAPLVNATVVATTATTNSQATSFIDSVADYIVRYFDWPSLVIIFVLTVFILLGVKDSTNVTLIFTSINILVVVTIVISSFKHLNWHNWSLDRGEVPAGAGSGGFLPFGWAGVIRGSSSCFFGFIGFDTIASSAEEAKNPRKNVPLSIILSLFVSFIAYMSIAIVQTLLWPYYDQDSETILPYIFGQLQMPIVYWIVLLGATTGLASSQLGGMYPLPRILYSMAQDKLIYGWLSHVNRRLKLPVRATILGSVLVAVLACLLDINDLAEMVSIGTLAAYSLVSLSVLILRYENRSDAVDDSTILSSRLSFNDILSATNQDNSANGSTKFATVDELSEQDNAAEATGQQVKKTPLCAKPSTPIRTRGSRPLVAQMSVGFHSWFKATPEESESGVAGESAGAGKRPAGAEKRRTLLSLLTSWKKDDMARDEEPDEHSSGLSKILIAVIVVLSITLDLVALALSSTGNSRDATAKPEAESESEHVIARAFRGVGSSWAELETLVQCVGYIVIVALATATLMLSRLPTSKQARSDAFQVPWVPLVPTLSIIINTLLMFNLSYLTWVRFTVWMSVGLFIYFTYGLWNSQGYLLQVNTESQLVSVDQLLSLFETLSCGVARPAPARIVDDESGPFSVAWFDFELAIEFFSQIDADTMAQVRQSSPRLSLLAQTLRSAARLPAGREAKNSYLHELLARYQARRDEAKLGDNFNSFEGPQTRNLIRAFACPNSSEAQKLGWPSVLGAMREIQSARATSEPLSLDLIERRAAQFGSAPVRTLHRILLKDLASKLATAGGASFAEPAARFRKHLEQVGYNYKC